MLILGILADDQDQIVGERYLALESQVLGKIEAEERRPYQPAALSSGLLLEGLENERDRGQTDRSDDHRYADSLPEGHPERSGNGLRQYDELEEDDGRDDGSESYNFV